MTTKVASPAGSASSASDDPQRYLDAGTYVDPDAAEVRDFAARATAAASSPREKAVAIYYAVRDGIRYDPYACVFTPEAFLAGNVAGMEAAFCVQKSILFAACCRAAGVPARLGFADVRNHLASPKLRERMGTDLFVFHGYAEVWLDGRWIKATPVFNRELCERFGVKPLEFDGRSDSIFHEHDVAGRRHMEYVRDRGTHFDLPYEEMVAAMLEAYPRFGSDPASDDAFA